MHVVVGEKVHECLTIILMGVGTIILMEIQTSSIPLPTFPIPISNGLIHTTIIILYLY